MLLVYWEKMYVLWLIIEMLLVASKEVGLEVNIEEIKYVFMSR